MKRVLRAIWVIFKWLVLVVVCVEILSFVAITASNFILYGHMREGSRAVYDPYTLFLQAHGVRPTTYNASGASVEGNIPIWMFGGSTMRGATPRDDKTIASQLAKALNARDSGPRFTVTNYGVNSFNSLMEVKYLQKLLIESPERPRFIIFYDGANDAKFFAEYRHPNGHHGYRRARGLIESYYRSWFGVLKPLNAAVYASFTKELYDKIHEVAIPLEPDSPMLGELATATEKRYDYVYRIARCYGAEFLLFWQPMIWVENCKVPEWVKKGEKGLILDSERFATVRRNFATPYIALAERLKKKPYFVSFQQVLCNRTVPAYQADGVHLTDDGRSIVAEAMARLIKERMPEKRARASGE